MIVCIRQARRMHTTVVRIGSTPVSIPVSVLDYVDLMHADRPVYVSDSVPYERYGTVLTVRSIVVVRSCNGNRYVVRHFAFPDGWIFGMMFLASSKIVTYVHRYTSPLDTQLSKGIFLLRTFCSA